MNCKCRLSATNGSAVIERSIFGIWTVYEHLDNRKNKLAQKMANHYKALQKLNSDYKEEIENLNQDLKELGKLRHGRTFAMKASLFPLSIPDIKEPDLSFLKLMGKKLRKGSSSTDGKETIYASPSTPKHVQEDWRTEGKGRTVMEYRPPDSKEESKKEKNTQHKQVLDEAIKKLSSLGE